MDFQKKCRETLQTYYDCVGVHDREAACSTATNIHFPQRVWIVLSSYNAATGKALLVSKMHRAVERLECLVGLIINKDL